MPLQLISLSISGTTRSSFLTTNSSASTLVGTLFTSHAQHHPRIILNTSTSGMNISTETIGRIFFRLTHGRLTCSIRKLSTNTLAFSETRSRLRYSITNHILPDITTILFTNSPITSPITLKQFFAKKTHPFTKLVEVTPLRRVAYLDPVLEHLKPEEHTPPREHARWRFTRLESPQVATTSTPKPEVSLRLTHTPELEYQSALLPAEPEEPTDPSSSDSDSDTDDMAGDKEAKMNTPPEFSRSAEKARDFLWQVDLYLTCKKDQFKNDTSRITWALSFMRGGPGGVWAGNYIDALTNATATSSPPSWTQFRAEFIDKFFPKNEKQEARNKLKHLLQGEARLRTTSPVLTPSPL